MKYRWIAGSTDASKLNPKVIEAITGIKLVEVTRGQIGRSEEDGSKFVLEYGAEIETKEGLTAEQLSKLDALFPDMTREGNEKRNLITELDELKARIEKLEKKVITR